MNFYRFLKYKVEGNSLLKGEDSWYRISDADEKPLWAVLASSTPAHCWLP
ncbi:hypothetical protein [Desulfuromonas sp. TF]|nr:hypothetical protein [Desulfuromonas sp. TF]